MYKAKNEHKKVISVHSSFKQPQNIFKGTAELRYDMSVVNSVNLLEIQKSVE